MPKSEANVESRRISDKLSDGGLLTTAERAFLLKQLQVSIEPVVLTHVFYCCRVLDDPAFAPFLEPHLDSKNVDTASMALWVLCWLGQAERHKQYILEAIDPGFPWDQTREIGATGLTGAGLHLKTHRDRDFAQLLLRWTPPEDMDELLDRWRPPAMTESAWEWLFRSAGKGMGIALGADPEKLIEDNDLYAACVKRFSAERQDG